MQYVVARNDTVRSFAAKLLPFVALIIQWSSSFHPPIGHLILYCAMIQCHMLLVHSHWKNKCVLSSILVLQKLYWVSTEGSHCAAISTIDSLFLHTSQPIKLCLLMPPFQIRLYHSTTDPTCLSLSYISQQQYLRLVRADNRTVHNCRRHL